MGKVKEKFCGSTSGCQWDKIGERVRNSVTFDSGRCYAISPALPVLKNIHIFRRDLDSNDGKQNLHGHYILWICLSGEGVLLVDGSQELMKAYDALCVLPGQPHMRSPLNRTPVEWLLIRFDANENEELNFLRHSRFKLDRKAWPLLENLLDSYERYQSDHQFANECGAALLYLLSSLRRFRTRSLFSSIAPSRGNRASEYVHEVCALLVSETQKDDPFKTVAARWNVTPHYLRIVFRQTLGVSPRVFINKRKLTLAEHLLVTTELPVSEVAQQCGFSGIYAFSRFFSKEASLSPSEYRKKFRK